MIRVGDVVSWHLPLAGFWTDISRPRGRVIHIDGEWVCVHRRIHLGLVPYVTKHLTELRVEDSHDGTTTDSHSDLLDHHTDGSDRSL